MIYFVAYIIVALLIPIFLVKIEKSRRLDLDSDMMPLYCAVWPLFIPFIVIELIVFVVESYVNFIKKLK